jgi:FixJ family two-component response regulator
MIEEKPTVFVIDDDPSVRAALDNLFQSVGLPALLFGSAREFLNTRHPPDGPGCIVMDMRLPGRNGLDAQRDLAGANIFLPVIFITGHPDIPISVHAMRNGAVEFLTKPFRDQDLLDAIQLALDKDRARRDVERRIAELRARFDTLTARQRQVMSLVVTGRLNKQIAHELGISEMAVKLHRGQVMRKMQAANLVGLLRMADAVGGDDDLTAGLTPFSSSSCGTQGARTVPADGESRVRALTRGGVAQHPHFNG